MNIFFDLEKYGQPKKDHKNIFTYLEQTEEEYRIGKSNQKDIPVPKKPSLWQNMVESLRCLGQIIVVVISIILIFLVGGYITRACDLNIDTDHVHFERFHQ